MKICLFTLIIIVITVSMYQGFHHRTDQCLCGKIWQGNKQKTQPHYYHQLIGTLVIIVAITASPAE